MVLALDTQELAVVKAILHDKLPPDVDVYIFGSRARGQAKAWSDLDLALHGPAPLSLTLLAELAEAFAESELAWKVDIVDLATVKEPFLAIIEQSKIPLPLSKA